MTEQEFELKSDFIPLMGLLKHTGVAGTGGHAGMMITEGEVKVNGKRELQKRKKLRAGDIVSVADYTIKLVAAPKA